MLAALRRAGFEEGHTKGAHRTMVKTDHGHTWVTVVVLGKREIPRGTLRSIIEKAGLTEDEFRNLLR